MIGKPCSIYVNWSAYDELSDQVPLTEAIAMRQFAELLRLRALGARFDAYLMDCFWYARDGAYRTWRRPHWPDGPDRWLAACREHGILPGLWMGTNCAWCAIDPLPAWRDSLSGDGKAYCLFSGGFLPHLLETLFLWCDRGVRVFKFDFADLGAATPAVARTMLPSEIRTANMLALTAALKSLRDAHPDVILLGYNGFEEAETMGSTSLPFRRTVNPQWLDTFDALYCGDPRPADVPAMNFWRSKDVYSDHMVRVYERNGFPLTRIDNAGFMIGTTGTCYRRGIAAWQGMLLLCLARGGWLTTLYGNLELLDEAAGRWLAKAQGMFQPLLAHGAARTFGAMPGTAQPYGFALLEEGHGLILAVNPGQCHATLRLPASGRILFRDAGFIPVLDGCDLRLGPEQMAMVGVGRYAAAEHELGVQADVTIPETLRRLDVAFAPDGPRGMVATLPVVPAGRLRIVARQLDAAGLALRSFGGKAPAGVSMGRFFQWRVTQGGRDVPVAIAYDKLMWSGLSWAAGEIDGADVRRDVPLEIRFSTAEQKPVRLEGEVYALEPA
jgi:hypothetical protein